MKYEMIKGFPNDAEIEKMTSPELSALSKLWLEKKDKLQETGEFQQFIKKMQREWAIETGIIERLYTWDRGVTEILIQQGVDATIIQHNGGLSRNEADNISKIITDQLCIIEGLFAFIKGDQPLTEQFIRTLHQQFTEHQEYTDGLTPDGIRVKIELRKGQYKKNPNNPKRCDGTIHEYCPPEFVKDEMEKLIRYFQEASPLIPIPVLSAWLHHRFAQIHPFQDGNGRIARALASLVFLKAGLFPLVIRDSDRDEYISALEQADAGDLSTLVQYFSKRQKSSILQALGIQQQVEHSRHSKQIISHAIAMLKAKHSAQKQQISAIYRIAEELHDVCANRTQEINEMLQEQLKDLEPPDGETYYSNFRQSKSGETDSHYYYKQIIEIAKKYDYYANLDQYKSWCRLLIHTQKTFEVVFSIHGYGYGDSGIMVVSGLTFEKMISSEDEYSNVTRNVHPAPELFQFNYMEEKESILKRFNEWMDQTLPIALAEWQKSIS